MLIKRRKKGEQDEGEHYQSLSEHLCERCSSVEGCLPRFLVSFYHLRNAYFNDDELEMNRIHVPAYFGFSLITTII